MNELRIKTPEGVLFSFALASPITRFLAWSIDGALVAVISSLAGTCVGVLGTVNFDFARALTILLYFALSIGYGIATEWSWRGQTLGKRLLRLRVVDEEGLRLQFNQIVIRNLLRAVDILPGLYLFGGVTCLFTRHAQRLGDIAANTVVVRTASLAAPDLDQLEPGKFNSMRQFPHLEARLYQQVTPAQAATLLQALLRRDDFDSAARLTLFAELAEYCRGLVRFPPEATESLADEQYVRNVVDILFRTHPR